MSTPGTTDRGGPFIAIDWGTTNRRCFLIDDGAVVSTERDDNGASQVAPGTFEAEVAAIRGRIGDLPILMAGMVGSNIGWHAVPYVAAPARLPDVAAGLFWADERTAIVPGVSWSDGTRGDVMRGEEVQFLGAAAAGLVPPTALLCHPGTHCKWTRVEDGAIARFTTAMNGELFALLRTHGLLARQLTAKAVPGPAFLAGVEEGRKRDLAASLFGIRARGLLGLADDSEAASFASGLIIGADTSARIQGHDVIYILAGEELGSLYGAAVEALGATAVRVDSHAAFVAGITRLWELCR